MVAYSASKLQEAREPIFTEISKERMAQDREWGGPTHDDEHSFDDWLLFITKHVGKASLAPDLHAARVQLVRIAALALAAIESFDRKHPEIKASVKK